MSEKIDASATIRGLDELMSLFDEAAELALNHGTRATLGYLAKTSRFRNRTGALRGAFTSERPDKRERVVFVSPSAPPKRGKTPPHIYARFLEYGTRFISARRFGAFAATAGEVALLSAVERRFRTVIRGN